MTYPNVLVLDYLRKTKKANPELEMKAEQYINHGYQRTLTFETPGGGFDWMGSPPAKNILSAYGLLLLTDMAKVRDVDERLIERTKQLLFSRQQSDGRWDMDYGTYTWHELNSALPVTAYVTWALAESGVKDAHVDKGVAWLRAHFNEAKDAYALALVANAFASTRDPMTGEALGLLANMAERTGGAAHWKSHIQSAFGAAGDGASIETTALAALAFMKAGSHADLINQSLTTLVRKKDALGNWGSTQATILTLKALMTSLGTSIEGNDGRVVVMVNGKEAGSVKFDEKNSDVMQLLDVSEFVQHGENKIELTTIGKVDALYQVVARQYLPWAIVGNGVPAVPSPLEILYTFDRTDLKVDDTVTAKVKVTFKGEGTTGMVLLDLGVPPGFTPLTGDLDELVGSRVISRYDLTGRLVICYLDKLDRNKPLEFSYRLKAKYPIRAKVPRTQAYDYYTPTTRDVARGQEVVVR